MEDLAKCVHCGLCVNACPTYAITGLEAESPRGRIYLARAIAEERIQLTEAVQGHWDLVTRKWPTPDWPINFWKWLFCAGAAATMAQALALHDLAVRPGLPPAR